MEGGYNLSYQLGSKLDRKVSNTQSNYFNRCIFNLLDKLLEIDCKHGSHRDPKLLDNDASYPKYGHVSLCTTMRKEYGESIKINAWTKLPQGHLGESTDTVKNRNGMKCYKCDFEYHLFFDFSERRKGTGDVIGSSNDRDGKKVDSAWKYIAPADENSTIEVNGDKYYYYAHCVCKKTKQKDFYNRTHPTERHQFPRVPSSDTHSSTFGTGIIWSTSLNATPSIPSVSSGPSSNISSLTITCEERQFMILTQSSSRERIFQRGNPDLVGECL